MKELIELIDRELEQQVEYHKFLPAVNKLLSGNKHVLELIDIKSKYDKIVHHVESRRLILKIFKKWLVISFFVSVICFSLAIYQLLIADKSYKSIAVVVAGSVVIPFYLTVTFLYLREQYCSIEQLAVIRRNYREQLIVLRDKIVSGNPA